MCRFLYDLVWFLIPIFSLDYTERYVVYNRYKTLIIFNYLEVLL